LEIAGHYDALAADPLRTCAQPIAKEYALTCAMCCTCAAQPDWLDSDPRAALDQAAQPLCRPMHLMQVDLLRAGVPRSGRSRLFGAFAVHHQPAFAQGLAGDRFSTPAR